MLIKGSLALLLAGTSLGGSAAAIAQGRVEPLAVTGSPELSISKIEIEAGRLVIEGETGSPGTVVTIVGTSYQATSGRNSKYTFNIDDRPAECELTLETSTGSLDLLVGNCGPKGETGPEGAQGIMGPTGPQGPQGEAGLQGPPGEEGPAGPQGEQGLAGVQGEPGPEGEVGPVGPQGEQGPTGATGKVGPMGPQGPQGIQGLAGLQGPQGPAGPQGAQGEQGPGVDAQGEWNAGLVYVPDDLVTYEGSTWRALRRHLQVRPGENPGAWELFAARGAQGEQGGPGPAGPQGPQGEPGAQGPQGPIGLQGVQGPAGPTGADGAQGQVGPQGVQGPVGPQGPAGESAFVARTGSAAPSGTAVALSGEFQTLCRVDPVGLTGEILLNATLMFDRPASGFGDIGVEYKILRDGVPIPNHQTQTLRVWALTVPVTLVVTDTPPPGSPLYSLIARKVVTEPVQSIGCYMTATEYVVD